MCTTCLTRRRFLSAGAVAGSGVALSGCDRMPNLVSDAQAEEMGLQAWQQIRQGTPASSNAVYTRTLEGVTRRLLETGQVPPGEWEAVVFADPQANAFALPGGKIGVYEGMFDVMENEDQLAAIVGHEIGHLSAEHAQERMSAQIARNAGQRLLAWLLDMGGVEFGTEIAAALGLGVEVGILLPYSRDHELEADRLGLIRMDAAGYDAGQAVGLWRNMAAAGGNRGPAFLATHPTPQSRIAEIEEILATL